MKKNYFSDALSVLAIALFITNLQFITSTPFVLAQSQSLQSETFEIVTSRGKYNFEIEIADEPQERTIGLMNRENLDARGGMLFVFERHQIINMWMKNTLISLDMIFISHDGTVAKITPRTTPHSLEIISSGQPVSYVLELAAGMAAFIGLEPGDQLHHRLFKPSGE